MTEDFKRALELVNFDLETMGETDSPDVVDDEYWMLDKEISLIDCFVHESDERYALRDIETKRVSLMTRRNPLAENRDLKERIKELEAENAKQDEEIDELQTKLERIESERDDMSEVIANARLDGAVQ